MDNKDNNMIPFELLNQERILEKEAEVIRQKLRSVRSQIEKARKNYYNKIQLKLFE